MTTDVGLDLSRFTGITLYEPEELVLSCGPATLLGDLETALGEKRQRFAFEPPDLGPLLGGEAGHSTIGGVIATNLSGPRRIQAGAPRDHLLGLRGVNGRGEAFKTGSRVMKNVTGYDLSKLMAGSYGTLAAMTMVTVKALPAAESEATVLLRGLDRPTALASLREALGGPFDVSAACFLPEDLAAGFGLEGSAAALRIDGFAPSVADRVSTLSARHEGRDVDVLDMDESVALWAGIRDVRPFVGTQEIVWRLSVAPTDADAIVTRITDSVGGRAIFDWGGGLVWLALETVAEPVVRQAVDAFGGHATLVRAPEEVRADVPVFHPQQSALAALARRVKQGFDPENILNPGRLWKDG